MADINLSLHIGAHKTASTHFQKSLDAQSDALRDAGVCYLGPRALRRDGRPLAKRLAKGQGARGLLAADATRLVISEENLMGTQFDPAGPVPLYPEAGARIKAVLAKVPDADVTLCLALRDPAPWLASLYAHALFNGRAAPGMAGFVAGCAPGALAWSDLINRLITEAGANRLILWRQEDYDRIAPDLFARVLGCDLAIPPLRNRVNASLSDRAIAALEDAGPDRPDPQGSARAAKAEFPLGGDNARFQPWSASELAASRAAYDADCAKIANLNQVMFLGL